MIQVEGTSPSNGDNPTKKDQNASHLPNISNTIQAILPQSSIQTNNDQQSDDSKFPQSKNNIIDDNKINSAFQNNVYEIHYPDYPEDDGPAHYTRVLRRVPNNKQIYDFWFIILFWNSPF